MKKYDVVCVGNAIVDVLAKVDDDFLIKNQMSKGAMILIDEDKAESIFGQIKPLKFASGGSAANTVSGIADLGAKCAYIGKICDDDRGNIFRKELSDKGIEFRNTPLLDKPSTAVSMIMVTNDAQRTMNTYLGACSTLCEDDIIDEIIIDSKIMYIEGYLWDHINAKKALRKALAIAANNNVKRAFTLSDSFCVERFRDEFIDLIKNDLDIIFGNEDEVKSLYQANSLEQAMNYLAKDTDFAIITRGSKGSLILANDEIIEIEPKFVENVVDTTGAGDIYAAGFLYGLSQEYGLEVCGKIANIVSSEIITEVGARANKDLKKLILDVV